MSNKVIFQDALSFILDCRNLGELLILNKALSHILETLYEDHQKVLEEVL